MPWICISDFNEILENNEKIGRIARHQAQMNRFREVINTCYFHAINYDGPRFTWCNNRTDHGRVLARLDRGFLNVEGYLKFPNAIAQHMIESSSDHCAILFNLEGRPRMRVKRRFHFAAMWTRSEDFREVIKKAWNPTNTGEEPILV